MKKLLLGLGAATSVIAPIAAVVACGETPEIHANKEITGQHLVDLAKTIKEQTGIDYKNESVHKIVTRFSAVTTSSSSSTSTSSYTITGVLKTALTLDVNGLAASVGTEVVLKISMTVSGTSYTTAITIGGVSLKKASLALTPGESKTIGAHIISALTQQIKDKPNTELTSPNVIDTVSLITGDTLGSYIIGSVNADVITEAEQTVLSDKMIAAIGSRSTALTIVTVSYNLLTLGSSSTSLGAQETIDLLAAINAYIGTNKVTADKDTLKTAIKTALDTIFTLTS